MKSKQLSKKYNDILKRTPNFLEKLSSKRMSRKAQAGLWIKGCNFLETIAWRLLEKRVQLRNEGVQLFKWSLKEKISSDCSNEAIRLLEIV